MRNLFEILKRNNLIKRNQINISAIDSISTKKIFEIAEMLVNEVETAGKNETQTIFAHSASTSLSGSREFCSHIEHRIASLEELARFALMYSDTVYIGNYFAEYNHYLNCNEEEIKRFFLEDIVLLNFIKPLIESKTITLFAPPKDVCVHQWAEMSFGQDSVKRLNKEHKRLEKDYLLNTEVSLEYKRDSFVFICEGPERLFEHGTWAVLQDENQLSKSLLSMPQIMSRIRSGEKVNLSKTVRNKLDLHERFAYETVKNVSYELSASQLLKTTFLTNKMLHIDFLKSISTDPSIEERNSIAEKYLTSFVPFVNDVEISKLVKLREREDEAFVRYRRALNEAIDEFRSQGKTFTEKDARAIYSDIIAPQLSSLEQKIKHAKKDLITKAYRSVIAVSGAITFGLYTGFIPMELAAMAKVLGFTKIASDILEKVLPLGDAAESIKTEEMYFLWQVKKNSK